MVGMVVMKIKMAKKISEVQTSIDIFKGLWYINNIEKHYKNLNSLWDFTLWLDETNAIAFV